ncbi:hypothetical protein [Paraburkholderia heleia]|uniref:hypothetical protein n=1 Tax=Paraburkholderia heleia TaxID=634127 RepID=UPI0012EE36F7|nr:hypothetical protein [Paraburkholderia heleia]
MNILTSFLLCGLAGRGYRSWPEALPVPASNRVATREARIEARLSPNIRRKMKKYLIAHAMNSGFDIRLVILTNQKNSPQKNNACAGQSLVKPHWRRVRAHANHETQSFHFSNSSTEGVTHNRR